MELFNEIDEFHQLLMKETSAKLDCDLEGFQDLESKYANLHESYSKEIENSKKVEKCLVKCLKFYSKLCKKYEAQQKLIIALEESVKEKVHSLEESLRTQEKLKGVIEVYRTERSLYAGITHEGLRKEKQLLLDICCKLISETVENDNVRSLGNLILRKFRKDLDDDKLIKLLKLRHIPIKKEKTKQEYPDDIKPPPFTLEDFKIEENMKEEKSPDTIYSPSSQKEEPKTEEKLENCVESDKKKLNAKDSDNDDDEEDEDDDNDLVDVGDDELDLSLPLLENETNGILDGEIKNEIKKNNCKNNSQLEKAEKLENSPINEKNSQFCNNSLKNITQKDETRLENNGERLEPEMKQKISNNLDKSSKIKTSLSSNIDDSKNSMNAINKSLSSSSLPEVFAAVVTSPEAQKLLNFSKSIFDVPEVNKNNEFKPDDSYLLEFDSPISENRKNPPEDFFSSSSLSVDITEEDLCKVFRETSNVRLLSPIRELKIKEKKILIKETRSEVKRKRNSSVSSGCSEPSNRSKRVKANEGQAGFLDSIMTAMSQQNEEFKCSKKVVEESKLEVEENVLTPASSSPERWSGYPTRRNSKENSFSQKSSRVDKDKSLEKVVMEELKNFVSSPMNSKEEADQNVKRCISVLRSKPEQIVARSMVAIVFENVDENVEIFERPAPPLTKTQHRLIVLLSVFKTVDPNSEKIPQVILNLIWEKLFPDKFFWPDDCVETATRFYTALCRSRNDMKTLWKFCLQAMTEMKQRCCLVVFTALKTWPDVLHNASTLQNNILAGTIVNIFLHMPKTEGLRNQNQKKKLLALKHLLMNFYQFKVDDTIETYTQKVFNSFWKEETGSEKALVLLAKCRDWNWTNKNILSKLKGKLKDWAEERVGDFEGNKVLAVIKQICTVFLNEGENAAGQAKEIVSCLSTAINSSRLSHETEQNIIQLLLQMKQYAEARTVIREWIPKEAISESLRNEIINVSAENILQELKLNKKKEGFEKKKNNKLKRLKKKSKKKKKKEKKKANNGEGNAG